MKTTTRQRGRRPKPYSQVERLVRMMRILAGRSMSVDELAHEFDVSRRQVYRDLERLKSKAIR